MSTFDRQAILDCLSKIVTPGIKLTALADELGLRKHEYAELREEIFDLVEDGTIVVLPGGAFALAPSGRPADPHAKPPAPPAPSAPTQRLRPIKKPAALPPRSAPGLRAGAPAKPGAAKKLVAPKRSPSWRPPAGVKSAPVTEEYDPETGEVRAVAASPTPAAATPAAAAPARVVETDPRFTGRITVHPAGYGFVATDEGETVFVPAKYRNHSLDGDRVVVDTWPGVRGTEGRVKEVLARGRARLTGHPAPGRSRGVPRARRSADRRGLRPGPPRRRAERQGRRRRRHRDHALSRCRPPRARRQAAQGPRRSRRSAHRDREDPRVRR